MNTVINAPEWVDFAVKPGSLEADLRQLVNMAGPLASGMAVALEKIQIARAIEEAGKVPPLTMDERTKIIGLCHVASMLLAEAANQGCEGLMNRC